MSTPASTTPTGTTTSRWWSSRPTVRGSAPVTSWPAPPAPRCGRSTRARPARQPVEGPMGHLRDTGTQALGLPQGHDRPGPRVLPRGRHGLGPAHRHDGGLRGRLFQFPVLQGMAMPTMETGIEPWLFMNWKRASEYMYTAQELEAARGQGDRPDQPGGPDRAARRRGRRARLPRGPGPADHPDGGQGQHPAGMGPSWACEPTSSSRTIC